MTQELQMLIDRVESALDRLDRECYTVDVRERHNSDGPVIATVVDRSWALHEFLFLKRDLSLIADASTQPQAELCSCHVVTGGHLAINPKCPLHATSAAPATATETFMVGMSENLVVTSRHKPAWQVERGDESLPPCAHDCPACAAEKARTTKR